MTAECKHPVKSLEYDEKRNVTVCSKCKETVAAMDITNG